MQVAGMDIWKKRWVVAVVEDGGLVDVRVADDAPSAIRGVPDACVIGIDIPIGLPSLCCKRQADLEARKQVGLHLASSVFPAPADVLLHTPTFAAANALAHEQDCPGVSQQTYALRTAILQVAPLAQSDPRIHEVHPEVSFSLAGGAPLETTKASWNGMRDRCRILKEHGLAVPDRLPHAGKAGVADVLDAVACAWSAWRVATDRAVAFPADGDADTRVIWG